MFPGQIPPLIHARDVYSPDIRGKGDAGDRVCSSRPRPATLAINVALVLEVIRYVCVRGERRARFTVLTLSGVGFQLACRLLLSKRVSAAVLAEWSRSGPWGRRCAAA